MNQPISVRNCLISNAIPFTGLSGATIEPLVPLLIFIGNVEFDKSNKNNIFTYDGNKSKQMTKLAENKKKRGFNL